MRNFNLYALRDAVVKQSYSVYKMAFVWPCSTRKLSSSFYWTCQLAVTLYHIISYWGYFLYIVISKVFDWITSYLRSRILAVNINGTLSVDLTLSCGVPQSFVSSPLYYIIYTLPLGFIFRKHGQ